MGPRFSARLSRARRRDHAAQPPDRARADRDRDARSARRYLASARHRSVKPIVRGFDRPNLMYEARKADKEADKLKILSAALRPANTRSKAPASSTPRRSRTRSRCKATSRSELAIPAAVYHSKLHKEDRTSVHNLFMDESIRAVVATNAFGLGIDKPNIRFVVHYDLAGFARSLHARGRARRPRRSAVALHPHLSHERYARAKLLPDRQVSGRRRSAARLRHDRSLRRASPAAFR